MEVLLRSLYGVTAVMAVPRRSTSDWPNPRWHCGVLNTFKVSAMPPRRSAVLTDFFSCGDHRGATAVYAVQVP